MRTLLTTALVAVTGFTVVAVSGCNEGARSDERKALQAREREDVREALREKREFMLADPPAGMHYDSTRRYALPESYVPTEGTQSPTSSSQPACNRSQSEILGVLGKHISKINFCVLDEKKRDTNGLLPSSLRFSFVVTPVGKVSGFQVLDRHYRMGPMKNCLVKVFRLVRYPEVGGANCPVTLPIKIGN